VARFFHNKMPLEPLIFFGAGGRHERQHSATARCESPLSDSGKADTAIFFLLHFQHLERRAGGDQFFSNFLIKRVVNELTCPQIKTFALLIPVPGTCLRLDPFVIKRGMRRQFITRRTEGFR